MWGLCLQSDSVNVATPSSEKCHLSSSAQTFVVIMDRKHFGNCTATSMYTVEYLHVESVTEKNEVSGTQQDFETFRWINHWAFGPKGWALSPELCGAVQRVCTYNT